MDASRVVKDTVSNSLTISFFRVSSSFKRSANLHCWLTFLQSQIFISEKKSTTTEKKTPAIFRARGITGRISETERDVTMSYSVLWCELDSKTWLSKVDYKGKVVKKRQDKLACGSNKSRHVTSVTYYEGVVATLLTRAPLTLDAETMS